MSLLNILKYPDPRLRTVATPVTQFDAALKETIADLFETMYENNGIGLAATQVDIHQRIIAIDISQDRDQPLCLINPEITEKNGETGIDEGCLSVPGAYPRVDRAEKITVKTQDEQGEFITVEAEGLLAICIQHEMDHLIGKLTIDYLSPLKRSRLEKKIEKLRREQRI